MESREGADPKHVTYVVAQRYSKRRKMSVDQIQMKHRLASCRCKVEHVFYRIKCQFGCAQVHYCGLYKNKCRLLMLIGLADLYDSEPRFP